jgi:hypothetical protein
MKPHHKLIRIDKSGEMTRNKPDISLYCKYDLESSYRLQRGIFSAFSYCLFNDAVSSSDYVASNDRMIN